ncbi:hypothetical protein EDD11_004750 [Mortierella claussenii]|nr:hypothetical protein EDD11_004750 [Mortierella claussenii]
MADHTTTTALRRTTTTRAAATETGTSRSTGTLTSRVSRATRTGTATTTGTPTLTSTASPTPTSATPEAAGGLSGAVIGGIGAGVVVLIALVGLLFYKRRKRTTVGTAEVEKGGKDGKKGGPSAANAVAALPKHNDISGPMSLAPQNGTAAAPAHRPEAQFREQQQFRPGMRDELFAQEGSAIHRNLNSQKENNSNNNNNANSNNNSNTNNNNVNNNNANNSRPVNNGGGPGYVNEKELYSGNNRSAPSPSLQGNKPTSNTFYDDDQLVNDYYGESDHDATATGPIGAQRSAPQPKDLMHGNLTPAPEYYLGKEDIDPRRDLRGLDSPATYVKKTPLQDPRQKQLSESSPRSSYSSDGGESAYLTLEQAQQAHNHKMMGHKMSISSIDMLLVDSRSAPERGNNNSNNHGSHVNDRSKNNGTAPSDHMLSVAMTESTVSMMPALPPTASPQSFQGIKHQNQQRHGPPQRGGPGQGSPMSSRSLTHEDPYAESAYSEDYPDDRSLASGSYYNPHYAEQRQGQGQGQYPPHRGHPNQQQQQQQQYRHPPQSPGERSDPYSSQPLSPPYRPSQPAYPQQGHNNNNNNNNRQYPGSPPYPNSRPQQPPPHQGPGSQRDGPYQRQY